MNTVVNAFDGSKAKVGDRVWSLEYGWGEIEDTSCILYSTCPIKVKFDTGECDCYTTDGKESIYNLTPDLYYGPPEIIGPAKPKRMVKKEVRAWLNIYPNGVWHSFSSKESADACACPDRIACVELTGSYEVEEG